MYDWANSAFSTIVVSALLGPYLSFSARSCGGLKLFSIPIEPDSIYPFFVSVSVILQLVLLPVVGATVDLLGNKRTVLVTLAAMGAVCTCMLGVLDPSCEVRQTILVNCLLFVFANLFFGASVAIYNSFLVDIAPPKLRDRVSCLGWAVGYLGGGLALGLCLGLFVFLDQTDGVRASFVLAGLWWFLFTAIYPARVLKDHQNKGDINLKDAVIKGIRSPFFTLKQMRKTSPTAWRFLLAYFFYNDGVQTVIAVASLFAVSTLKIRGEVLILLILFIQFIAMFGSLFFALVGEKLGTKQAIVLSLVGWLFIVFYAYLYLDSLKDLFLLAFFTALVMGGTQALSRSLFSELVPISSQAEYFGFYEVSEKGSSWLGPMVFAIAVQLTGSSRVAMVSIGIFFVVGIILLIRMKGKGEAMTPVRQ